VDELFGELVRLLRDQAEGTDADHLQRARNQILVRSLRAHERAAQRVEAAAQDLFTFGRVRSRTELLDRLASVDADQVRSVFQSMLDAAPAVAVTGKTGRAIRQRVGEALAALKTV
jgi:predicted Zn-dependent peptidase